MKKLFIFFGFFTTSGIILYWLSVFLGIFKVAELVPGYTNWFISFPIADLWIAICALLSSVFLIMEDKKSVLFGILAGSSMIFLGLYALLYGVNTGLLFQPTIDEYIEILIKVYCLTFGPLSIIYHWKKLRS